MPKKKTGFRLPTGETVSTEKERIRGTWKFIARHPRQCLPRYFHIRDKAADCIPFEPNASQKLILDAYEQQRLAEKPVRIIILKPRQTGISTLCEALVYSLTATQDNVESMVVAHDKESAQHLLRISNMYYRQWPEDLRPMRSRANRNELYFDVPVNPLGGVKKEKEMRSTGLTLNSRIRVETARDLELGRSHTIQHLHLSEYARWMDPKLAMLSLKQAVPNLPNTSIFIESTAKGAGNAFHRLWKRAEEGDSEFVAVFIPWWIHEEYVMKPGADFKRTYEEEMLVELWGLRRKFGNDGANAKLRWRRWCISENCDGDVELFQQEYPGTAEEAFVKSGANVFPFYPLRDHYLPIVNTVKKAASLEEGHPVTGKDDEVLYRVMETRISLRDEGGKILWDKNPGSSLRVYRGPKPKKRYIVTCDPAEGIKGRDYIVMMVFDRSNLEQCAVWRGWQDIGLVADEAVILAKWYNQAWIFPERNTYGQAFIDRVREIGYARLYKEPYFDGANKQWTDKWGFRTTQKSKPRLITKTARAIREHELMIYSRQTVDELMGYTYQVSANGEKVTAGGEGITDDCVVALMLAVMGIKRLGMYLEEEEDTSKKPVGALGLWVQEARKPVALQNPVIMGSLGRKVGYG